MDAAQEFLFHLQSPPLSGGVDASSAVGEAYINGVYAGLNLRSLLTHGSFDPAPDAHNVLGMQITEQLISPNDAVLQAEVPPFNFFPEPAMFTPRHVEKLPSLFSLETATRTKSDFPINHRFAKVVRAPPPQQPKERVSEKTRRLQKLLPLDKKMDTAKVLEETYKYIKFLEAQVSVLRSMPDVDDEDYESRGNRSTTAVNGGDLRRLSRQQLLQVLVNSPAAQAKLYSNGCCIYLIEQMDLLKKNAEKKAPLLRIPYDSNPNPLFYT